MKTLFQRMETELNSNLYLYHDFNEIEKEFLRLTKEWLEEVNADIWLKKGCPQGYHSNDPEAMKLCGKRQLLRDLVLELSSDGNNGMQSPENPQNAYPAKGQATEAAGGLSGESLGAKGRDNSALRSNKATVEAPK